MKQKNNIYGFANVIALAAILGICYYSKTFILSYDPGLPQGLHYFVLALLGLILISSLYSGFSARILGLRPSGF